MNKADLASCVGEQGDMCYVGCDTGFTLVGEMLCDMGTFHGAFCVPDQPGAPACSGAASVYYLRGEQAFNPLYAHFDRASLNNCIGDVGDTCDFQCETGTSVCHSCTNILWLATVVALSIMIVSLTRPETVWFDQATFLSEKWSVGPRMLCHLADYYVTLSTQSLRVHLGRTLVARVVPIQNSSMR